MKKRLTPTEKFFELSPREATSVAWRKAKQVGRDDPNFYVFNDLIRQYKRRQKNKDQLRLL